jgi:hypothetical protein
MKLRNGLLLSFSLLAAVVVACGGSVTKQQLAANCTVCADSCVDVRVDRDNCGTCGNKCAAGQMCSGGQCAPACAEGQTGCDGRCVDTTSDPANCGACGTKCASAGVANACVSGQCTFGACKPGFADCDGDLANGCEKSVDADMANCGGCGIECLPAHATGGACTGGACGYAACESTFADCDGRKANGCETNTAIDGANCGACGVVCSGGAVCVSGGCATVTPNIGKTSFAYPNNGAGAIAGPEPFTLTIQSITPAVIFYRTDGGPPSYNTPTFGESPVKIPITGNTTVTWITSADSKVQTHVATVDASLQTCLGEFLQNVRFDTSAGPVVVASPGQVITGKVDYRVWRGSCGYCPSCVRIPSYGILATEGCYPNAFSSFWPGDARSDVPIKVTAPALPGVYRLRRNTQLDFACYMGRGVGGDDGTIVVQ